MSTTIDESRAQKGLLRIKQVLELIPVGRSTIWLRVRAGTFPKPVKLFDRTTVWYRADIEEFINAAGKAEMAPWVRRKTRPPAAAPADITVRGR